MPITKEQTLTKAWGACAAGAGYVTVCPIEHEARWAISSTGVPAIGYGHPLEKGKDKPFNLEAGESLYIKGLGLVAITAKNPLP